MKSTPLLGAVWGGEQRHTTEEWTTPGTSVITHPVPTPLTQWISSRTVWLKLAANRLGVMVKLAGLTAVGSVLTLMSHPMNGSILATFTW